LWSTSLLTSSEAATGGSVELVQKLFKRWNIYHRVMFVEKRRRNCALKQFKKTSAL